MPAGPESAAFLFCDLVGSTDLLSRLGNDVSEEVRRRYFAVLRDAVRAARGEEVKNLGDGLMVVFRSSAADAVACAEGMQRGLDRLNRERGAVPLAMRIGVAGGDASLAVEEDDWFGPAVNTAARLCAKAAPGQILIQQGLTSLGRPVGALALKGLPEPVATVEVDWRDEQHVVSLPTPLDIGEGPELVGRKDELARVMTLWQAAAAGAATSVIVTGEAGTGKTRLAREVARRVAGGGATVAYGRCRFDASSPFEPLVEAWQWWAASESSDENPDRLSVAVEEIVAAACDRGPVLLVVDDLHHAQDETIRLLGDLLRPSGRRLLLLGLLREDGPVWSTIATRLPGASVRLDGLSTGECAELVAQFAPALSPARVATMAEVLVSRTAGNTGHVVDALWNLAAGHLLDPGALDDDVGTVIDHTCPYRGLTTYGPSDHTLFFGRDALISRLVECVRTSRLVGVLGPSGSGKSSVVRAGLVPALQGGAIHGSDQWPVALFTPGRSPLSALATALAELPSTAASPASLERQLHEGAAQLDVLARRLVPSPVGRMLLVVDQFEELFTQVGGLAERDEFVELLVEATRLPGGPVTVVVVLRADFYGHLVDFRELAVAVEMTHVLVGPMSANELSEAVRQPAFVAGLRLEDGLVDRVAGEVTDQAGALPLLSHALRETWRRREGRLLTLAGYRDAGGVRGAVARSAEAVYETLPAEQQDAARKVFLRLVTPGEGTEDTRRRLELGELPEPLAGVLPPLVNARLITIDADTVEVAHEALIREWPRLRAWLDEDREALRLHRHLTETASSWHQLGRDPAELYRGARLESALDWAAVHNDDMNAVERQFLDAARAERNAGLARERRQLRRLRMSLTAVGIVAAVALLAGTLAVVQQRRARGQAAAATAAQRRAEDEATRRTALQRAADVRRLVAESKVNQGQNLPLALLLAAEANRRDDTFSTRGALESALLSNPRILRYTYAGAGYTSAALSEDGTLLAAGRTDGAVDLIDPRTGARAGVPLDFTLNGRSGAARRVAVNADGSKLATALDGDPYEIWDLRTRKKIGSFPSVVAALTQQIVLDAHDRLLAPEGGSVLAYSLSDPAAAPVTILRDAPAQVRLALSPDGSLVAALDATWTVSVARTDGTGVVQRFPTGVTGVQTGLAWSADGARLAVAPGGGTGALFEVATGKRLATMPQQNPNYAFSGDGRWLGSAGTDGALFLRDPMTGAVKEGPLGLYAGIVFAVWASPDSTQLYAVTLQGAVVTVDLTGRTKLGEPFPSLTSNTIAVSPDGRWMAASQPDGTVSIVDMSSGNPIGPALRPEGTVPFRSGLFNVAFSPNGRQLAFGAATGRINIFDLPEGRLNRTIAMPYHGQDTSFYPADAAIADKVVETIAWSPDGKTIAAGSWQTVYLFDARTGVVQGEISRFKQSMNVIKFSPDSRLLAAASFDGTAWLIDVATGQPVGEPLATGQFAAAWVAWTPDGSGVAVADFRQTTVKILDVATRTQRGPTIRATGAMWFSPDGQTLGLLRGSGEVNLVDVASGQRIGDPIPSGGGVPVGVLSPDGRMVVTGGGGPRNHLGCRPSFLESQSMQPRRPQSHPHRMGPIPAGRALPNNLSGVAGVGSGDLNIRRVIRVRWRLCQSAIEP